MVHLIAAIVSELSSALNLQMSKLMWYNLEDFLCISGRLGFIKFQKMTHTVCPKLC